MTITYDAPNNIITVTGYTEGTPCNFTDIYNADKAGTLSLHARTGITGTDANPVAVDRAERPADYVVLGGASNDLYITVANWNGTTATIRITGTDRDGAAQTEDIVVTANGDYYTTKWFKTITHTQVTAFTGTSFDYDLTQGQWGVISRQCTDEFCFDAIIVVGDSSTSSWLIDTEKQVHINDIVPDEIGFIRIRNNATVRFGRLVDDAKKITDESCSFFIKGSGHNTFIIGRYSSETNGNFEMFGGMLSAIDGDTTNVHRVTRYLPSNCKMYNVSAIGGFISEGKNMYNVLVTNTKYGFYNATGDLEQLESKNNYFGIAFYGGGTTVKNVVVRGCTYSFRPHNIKTAHAYIVNGDVDNWTMIWATDATKNLYRQYEFDLKVIDKDGNNINGATVKIWDKDSTLIVDTTTDANGVIATQTIPRGYYNHANGDTLQEYSPHLIKVEKAGYTTYEADFTLEEKTDWTIALQTGGGLLRNPPMTGGMV